MREYHGPLSAATTTLERTPQTRRALLDRLLARDDPQRALYAPLCDAGSGRPFVVAHLGQSLDGFIATRSGESRFVTGQANLVHLHRLRALCDAVVVGAGTVAADDPRLTTRLVEGPDPLRVIVDPRRRLSAAFRVFTDGAAASLLVCDAALATPGERLGQAEVCGIPTAGGQLDLRRLLGLLDGVGCRAVFVEGGGVTVSAFVDAGLVDRLHVAVAPVLLGAGRPGLRRLDAASLPGHRLGTPYVYPMGDDVLVDLALRVRTTPKDDRTTGAGASGAG
jgi:diaminohydroxyphosphoribosylaminopyrimidine deaminase/5-amino-6-(5-phosphoribosylamino)uracil reductase